MANQLSPTSAQHLILGRQEIDIVWEEEVEHEPVLLASKKVFN